MTNKIIIAFSGKKRSGKNTAANFMKQFFPKKLGYEELAFADPVKRTAAIALGLPLDYFFCDKNKVEVFTFCDGKKMTGRTILQTLGTEALRDNFNDSVWLTNAINRINQSPANVILITDLRFLNELDFLRNIGAKTIRINRGDLPNKDDHYSENALDGEIFDYYINNDKGDLNFLKQEIQKITKEIL